MREGQKRCKFGTSPNEIFEKIKEEIICLKENAIRLDILGVKNSMLHETLRAKLTYIYNKEQWIPICVSNDIDRILTYLNIGYNKKEKLTEKRYKLCLARLQCGRLGP